MKVAVSHGSINLESIGRVKVYGHVYDRFDRIGEGEEVDLCLEREMKRAFDVNVVSFGSEFSRFYILIYIRLSREECRLFI